MVPYVHTHWMDSIAICVCVCVCFEYSGNGPHPHFLDRRSPGSDAPHGRLRLRPVPSVGQSGECQEEEQNITSDERSWRREYPQWCGNPHTTVILHKRELYSIRQEHRVKDGHLTLVRLQKPACLSYRHVQFKKKIIINVFISTCTLAHCEWLRWTC